MAAIVEAIYEEEGILRLLAPVPFQVGEHVQVTLDPTNEAVQMQKGATRIDNETGRVAFDAEARRRVEEEASKHLLNPQEVAERLLAIAAMPMESGGEPFSGEDHDRILYGGERGAW